MFVNELRRLEKECITEREYILTAAPHCEFPDRFLGPEPGYALGDLPEAFDKLFVQFRSDWCTAEEDGIFQEMIGKWLDYSEQSNGGKIFLGLPAGEFSAGYLPPDKLDRVYEVSQNFFTDYISIT